MYQIGPGFSSEWPSGPWGSFFRWDLRLVWALSSPVACSGLSGCQQRHWGFEELEYGKGKRIATACEHAC